MWSKTAIVLLIFLGSGIAHGDDMYSAPSPSAATSAGSQNTADVANRKKRCQEEWRKYRESQACFAPYRLADGGIKAEAFKHCTELKQPELCE